MGMCIDVKVGESVIVHDRQTGKFNVTVKAEKKSGNGVRLVFTAPDTMKIIPPNKQGIG